MLTKSHLINNKGVIVLLTWEDNKKKSLKAFRKSAQGMKNLPAIQKTEETWIHSLGWKESLEEEMATHSSILA